MTFVIAVVKMSRHLLSQHLPETVGQNSAAQYSSLNIAMTIST